MARAGMLLPVLALVGPFSWRVIQLNDCLGTLLQDLPYWDFCSDVEIGYQFGISKSGISYLFGWKHHSKNLIWSPNFLKLGQKSLIWVVGWSA